MPKTYELGPARKAVNALFRTLARVGLAGRHTYILTVRGRKSGKPHSTPVTLIEDDGRFLVAPYGEVGWVRNARAAGTVELRRGARTERLAVEELAPEQAAPVLQQYVKQVAVTRSYFTAQADSPVSAFVEEAGRHPVFRLTPVA